MVCLNGKIEQILTTIQVLLILDCLKPKKILYKTIENELSVWQYQSVIYVSKSSSRIWLESIYNCIHYLAASLLDYL